MAQDTSKDILGEANPENTPSPTVDSPYPESLLSEATVETISKYVHGKAKTIAIAAQKARVSRRLIMAKRAQNLTCVCQDTGIVSILEIPAIPGFAAEYLHPLSILSNARGIAQRGVEYLVKLDTQVLAGILLTLAGDYDLFRFKPFDTGAHKNALLRSAGKEVLIDAIIIIENLVHSRNRQFLPGMSFVDDANDGQYFSTQSKISNYIKDLAKAIASPDHTVYDANAKPVKAMRPVYVKDVEKAERKISYLARQELSRAKKELDADKKDAKNLIGELYKVGKIDIKGKKVLTDLFADMTLVTLEPETRALICMKLAVKEHAAAESLIAIVKKDRKILTMDITEIQNELEIKEEAEVEAQILANTAVASIAEGIEESEEVEAEEEVEEQKEEKQELQPPAGLSPLQQLLWKKKHKEVHAVQNKLPSVATYIPSETKEKLGKDN